MHNASYGHKMSRACDLAMVNNQTPRRIFAPLCTRPRPVNKIGEKALLTSDRIAFLADRMKTNAWLSTAWTRSDNTERPGICPPLCVKRAAAETGHKEPWILRMVPRSIASQIGRRSQDHTAKSPNIEAQLIASPAAAGGILFVPRTGSTTASRTIKGQWELRISNCGFCDSASTWLSVPSLHKSTIVNP
jgi:hypothetical protein